MKPLSEIFDVRYGNSLSLNKLTVCGPSEGIPFVSRKMGDNGVSAYVKPLASVALNPANTLTCALSGNGVLSTFIQERPYYTGFHVAVLDPIEELTQNQLLYYALCIRANRYRYSWGRQANRTLKGISLPERTEFPNWVSKPDLDQFVGRDAPIDASPAPSLSTSSWEAFLFEDLFDIERGRGPRIQTLTGAGSTPFITSSASNNGFSGFCDQPPEHPGNVLTVNRNGSVGEAYYQPEPFCSTEDVHVYMPRFELDPFIGLFLCALIRRERYRFGYGRKWGLERMRTSQIRLPVDSGGTPDWALMSATMRRVRFSAIV
jgi:hypothetical protein